jgi:hypothetical protein
MQVVNPKIKCNLSIMLLERLPEVQSLSIEDKWRLIDELWADLAQEVERAAVDENTLAPTQPPAQLTVSDFTKILDYQVGAVTEQGDPKFQQPIDTALQ